LTALKMKTFNKILLAILSFSVLFLPAGASVSADQEQLQGPLLQPAMDRMRKFAGSAGIQIVALPSGQVIAESRAAEPFVPASLVKMLTGYTALKKLGPTFRFSTALYAMNEPSGGVVQSDIWIKSNGDPYFVADNANQLARALRDRGVRQIRGGVYADNSFFQPGSEQVCLDSDCIGVYNPVISATAVDFNLLTVRLTFPPKAGKPVTIDSVPAGDYARIAGRPAAASGKKKGGGLLRVRSAGATGSGQEEFLVSGSAGKGSRVREFRFHPADPAGFSAHAMRTALERSGIKVEGQTAKEGTMPAGAKAIAVCESPPLLEIVSQMNKYSNNFMAEMLLRSIGGHLAGAPGTPAKGIAIVREALQEAGIQEQLGMLDCGSGLSRFCRITPDTFSRLLTAAWKDPALRDDFFSSLAVNAEEGTLRRRMRKPGLTVHGKTGTLNDVIGFAGYVTGPSGKTFAVSIMLNDVRDRAGARQAIDALLEEVAFSS